MEIVHVDAFASQPFEGNPAAICLLEAPVAETWMQALANEMNLSETAFPVRRSDGDWDLRWFTPRVEVDLCGHATLGSAHALWETGREQADKIRFHTRSGVLICRRVDDGIVMEFPATPAAAFDDGGAAAAALSVEAVAVGRNDYDVLVEVASEAEVLGTEPDLLAVAAVADRGVMVTAQASRDGFDIVSRFFGPAAGVDEDPVTGSAHCTLAPWWADRLGDELVCRQVSARGGTVRTKLTGDRVELTGTAVTVFCATLARPLP